MNIQKIISYLIKFFWMITFLLIIFLDRENKLMVYSTIVILFFISTLTTIRAINSRDEWRKMIEDGDVEIKDKISFDK
tara:strand:+ start:287 stop:520 length:234 start_codon:yes stop_codon:yes gene_type:complete